jgi:hypothetical protein
MSKPESEASKRLWICLHDLNVAVGRAQVDCGLSSSVNQRINFFGVRGCRSCDWHTVKIAGELSMDGFGDKMKSSIAGKKSPCVSTPDICVDGKRSMFPPIEGDREIASPQLQVGVTKAIVGKHAAIA